MLSMLSYDPSAYCHCCPTNCRQTLCCKLLQVSIINPPHPLLKKVGSLVILQSLNDGDKVFETTNLLVMYGIS